MEIKQINEGFSVSGQISAAEIQSLSEQNVKSLICNRPDNEAPDQPAFESLQEAASQHEMQMKYLPVVHDTIKAEDVLAFEKLFTDAAKPLHAFCRSGLRSITLWSLMQIRQGVPVQDVVQTAQAAGFDFSKFQDRFAAVISALTGTPAQTAESADNSSIKVTESHEIVIVGAGAAGLSVASSLLKRKPGLDIVLIDPADSHYYQPGFTFVGGGVFDLPETRRDMHSLIPSGVKWIKAAVESFQPENNCVTLDNQAVISYQQLVVCPGLKLNWAGVEGLEETLGKHGVTSNYSPSTAPYTWELVQNLKQGKAIFTQPPMPIKCAGAPQKALYLSADYWFKKGLLGSSIQVEFCNAGAVLFGVKDFVPALQQYMDKYQATLSYNHNLVKVDGPAHKAWFSVSRESGEKEIVEKDFNMLHVCPPQQAPDFIRQSPLVDQAGWVDVDQQSMQHKRYANIWSLGDVSNTPNAKTAAAVRVQAPILAENLLYSRQGKADRYDYNGYGACPLTVERGKIVLAEFGYGGKLLPTLPVSLLKGTSPTRLAWFLKEKVMPRLYWNGMLKGKETLVKPGKE
jgi:sulfide:quinone oxidoreductase